jgi:hypothetical protein
MDWAATSLAVPFSRSPAMSGAPRKTPSRMGIAWRPMETKENASLYCWNLPPASSRLLPG